MLRKKLLSMLTIMTMLTITTMLTIMIMLKIMTMLTIMTNADNDKSKPQAPNNALVQGT